MSVSHYFFNRLVLILAGIMVQLTPASALDLDIRSNRSNRLDFSLQIDRSKIEINNPPGSDKINLTRIGIVSIEVPPSGLQFGLLLGYAYADFSSSDIYESIDMDGYYVGVSVRAYLFELNQFAAALSGHYIYQSIDGRDELAKSSLSWDEFLLRTVLEYRIRAVGALYGGIMMGDVDAHYRYSGSSKVSVDLENKQRQGAVIGFNYLISPLETVGISYQQGFSEGVFLNFRKLF